MKRTNFLSQLFLFPLLLLPACTFFNSNIKEINSVVEVQNIFEHAVPGDLFVFDLDDTVFEVTDVTMQKRFRKDPELKKIKDSFIEFIQHQSEPYDYWEAISSKFYTRCPIQPVEAAMIEAIKAVQQRGVQVIALTAMMTGRKGIIPQLEAWRYGQLKSLGLDFSGSFAFQEIRFDELQHSVYAAECKARMGRDPHPANFYKGIISVGCLPKGVVLKLFFEKIGCKPTHVFFFDDQRKNNVLVAQAMKETHIPCECFIYKAATAPSRSSYDLDIRVARYQYELMEQRNEYVSYEEAKKLFDVQKNILPHNKSAVPVAP